MPLKHLNWKPLGCLLYRKRASVGFTRSLDGDALMSGTNGGRWSRDVTERSDALDLEQDVFTKDSPRAVAESLKRSAEQSHP